MPISVENIFNSENLRESGNIVAGEGGLGKPISGITVMEVADFIKFTHNPNLFILTTFSFLKDSAADPMDLLKTLIDKKISGLGIKLNRYIKDIPKGFVDICNVHDIPLFLINEDFTFSQIISDANFLIYQNYYKDISLLNKQYDSLYQALNKGKGLSYFVGELAKMIGCEVVCTDLDLNIIKSSSTFLSSEMIDELSDLDKSKVNNKDNTRISEPVYMVACSGFSGLKGYLFIYSKNKLNTYQIATISQFKEFISMILVDTSLKDDLMQREKLKVLQEILFTDDYSDKEIISKLASINFNLAKNFQILYLENPSSFNLEEYEERISKLISELIGQKDYIFKKINHSYILIVNLPKNYDSLYDQDNIAKKLYIKVKKRYNLEFYIAYSNVFGEVSKLSKVYNLLSNSVKVSRLIDEDKKIIKSFEFIPVQIYIENKENPLFQYIKKEIVDKIDELDRGKEANYWETLKQCLFTKSIQEAADKLYVHKTTVNYRLNKIKTACGLDYSDPFEKLQLIQATLIHFSEMVIEK